MLEMKTMEKEKYRSMSSQTSDPKDVEDTSPVTFIVGANEGVTQDVGFFRNRGNVLSYPYFAICPWCECRM